MMETFMCRLQFFKWKMTGLQITLISVGNGLSLTTSDTEMPVYWQFWNYAYL